MKIRRTFLQRILARAIIVSTIAVVLTSVIVYGFVSREVVERKIQDDVGAAEQTALQITAFLDQVRYSAIEVIVEPQVRRILLSLERDGSELTRMEATQLRQRLRILAASRPYIHSLAVLDLEDRSYWSVTRSDAVEDPDGESVELSVDDGSTGIRTDDLGSDEAMKLIPRGSLVSSFTQRFSIRVFDDAVDVFGVVVPIRGIQDTSRQVGYLLVGIHVDQMRSLIEAASARFDGYLWLDTDGSILAAHGVPETLSEAIGPWPPPDGADASAGGTAGVELHTLAGGHALSLRGLGPNWRISLYSSDAALIAESRRTALVQAAYTLAALGLLLGLLVPSLIGLARPIHDLALAMNRAASGELEVRVPIAGGPDMERLTSGFNHMAGQLQEHIDSLVEFEREVKGMEFDLLAAQINPHFIYNTLNSVIYLARQERSGDVTRMVSALISILQDTLRVDSATIVDSLESEVEMTRHYLEIQRYRYGDMFEVEWKIDSATRHRTVPRSIIQPLVENALFHGALPQAHHCRISIESGLQSGFLCITVRDDGVGMSSERLSALRQQLSASDRRTSQGSSSGMSSIGLRNIRLRLRHIYGAGFHMNIESEQGVGTAVSLVLPASGETPALEQT